MATKEELKEERDKIVLGLEETYRRLLEYKKQKKSLMVVIRDGEIVELDPNTMPSTIRYSRKAG